MKKEQDSQKCRPPFHVDQSLKDAAKKAAKVFEQEERDLKKAQYAEI